MNPQVHAIATPEWLRWPTPVHATDAIEARHDAEPAPRQSRQPVVWRPMTDRERRAARAFNHVTFLPGTSVKRIARTLLAQAEQDEPRITDKQAAVMWKIVWKFRRQINDKDVLNVARSKASGT